ncbi:hypothetical protein [Candidatus Poriferisodalis sp.]|uniref:hypothetical protein n=1 Tax=Candidatus Poriferisodalis sp. TaxID=3101277 RepID=UPI003B0179E4
MRLAGAIAAMVLIVAACGGGTSGGGGAEVATPATSASAISAAPPTTAAPSTTAAPPTTAASVLPADAMGLLVTAFENSAGPSVRGDMSLDMSEFMSVDIQFETDGSDNYSMVMSLDQMTGGEDPGLGIELRFVDDVQYVQFVVPEEMQGLVGAAMPEGWFTLDADTAAEMGIVCPSPVPGGAPVGGVCQLPNDNTFMIEHLTGAEIVGIGDFDGSAATQVRYTVDVAALAAESSAMFGGVGGAMPFGGDFGPEELIFDVWIDGDGFIRRLSLDLGAALEGLEELMGELDESESRDLDDAFASLFDVTNVINFYDYNADITIEAPPADEILGDFGDMMGPAVSSGGGAGGGAARG